MLLLGGAMTATPAVRAKQKAMPVIGYLNGTSPEANAPLLAAFRQGLDEAGWVEGQNLVIEYRWAEYRYERLRELATDLVDRKVDVIAACGGAGEALIRACRFTGGPLPWALLIDILARAGRSGEIRQQYEAGLRSLREVGGG